MTDVNDKSNYWEDALSPRESIMQDINGLMTDIDEEDLSLEEFSARACDITKSYFPFINPHKYNGHKVPEHNRERVMMKREELLTNAEEEFFAIIGKRWRAFTTKAQSQIESNNFEPPNAKTNNYNPIIALVKSVTPRDTLLELESFVQAGNILFMLNIHIPELKIELVDHEGHKLFNFEMELIADLQRRKFTQTNTCPALFHDQMEYWFPMAMDFMLMRYFMFSKGYLSIEEIFSEPHRSTL